MKKKIIITEEQLKYIVDFIGKEADINEQGFGITKSGKLKVKIDQKRTKLGSEVVSGDITSDNITNSINWINENRGKYEKLKGEFESKLRFNSKKIWENWMGYANFLASPDYKNNITFTSENIKNKYEGIYYVVNFLKIFETYLDKKVKEIVIRNKGEKVVEPSGNEKLSEPINFTSKIQNSSEGKPFEDNLTAPTQMVFNKLDEIVLALDEQLKTIVSSDEKLGELYNNDPTAFKWNITNIMTASSASRYSNTEPAENKNFITLSKERAVNGYNAIKEYLLSKGLDGENILYDETSIQYTGDNGDGSSGPPPPYGNRMANLTNEGKLGVKPNYIVKGTPSYEKIYKQSIEKYGTPYSNKNEYDQHKWFIFSVNFRLTISRPPVPTTPKTIGSYSVTFMTSKLKLDIELPNIGLNFSLPKGTKASKTKADACPFHGKKGWWTKLHF